MNVDRTRTFAQRRPRRMHALVRVHPGARKNSVTGVHAGALKIALTAPPVDGKANEALIAFLAETLRLPRARVSSSRGARAAQRSFA